MFEIKDVCLVHLYMLCIEYEINAILLKQDEMYTKPLKVIF